ncbi:MAG: tetratricopeptide repeat protein [Acidobacteria bacterium]|nr:tetratricopeptide repeat protein [Acidobacteriota bacterium]
MTVDVNKHLERAKRYLERNKLEDAIEAYHAVLEAAPHHQEAMQALGDLYARVDKPERAATYYGLLFDRLTDPREEPKAVALYTRFLRNVSQPPERVARYALLLQKQNKPEEAIEQYTAAAEQFEACGRVEQALECHERIAQLDPDNAARHLALGELAERMGNLPVAARGFLRAGQLAKVAGEVDGALELYARAYQLAPEERGVALLYAQARLHRGEAGAAVELLEPLAPSETDPVFLETFGEALMHVGQLDRARSVLEQFYRERADSFGKLLELADHYIKAKQEASALELLAQVKKRMCDAHRENEFAAQLDRVAEANPSSVGLTEFWGALYNELNREAKYFDVLVRLFDVYLAAGNVTGACETLDRLVDIDPYDFRNQQRIERLEGRVDPAYLRSASSRLVKAASQGPQALVIQRSLSEEESEDGFTEEGRAHQALEDLLVQAEIFLQYSLQAKAVERLQKIAEMFPGEEERNERLRNLYQLAHWSPAGSKLRAESSSGAATASSQPGKTGAYSPETLRDLSKINEINQLVYRQANPKVMLSVAVNQVGSYLRVTRCLAVMGAPGQPPQMAAEYCAPGVEASLGGLIVRLLSQIERAAPDSLGGLPLEAAAAPVLREMGLETALGVQLTDKETQTPAGMLVVGHAAAHKWKPNETYFLQAVGDQMLLSVNHTRLRTLVRTLAVADEKTGLLARSSYTDCLLGETQRAKSQGTPLALAILQVDRGPELIQQQGEGMVERHMEQLARALQPVARQNDLAVKYTAWALAFILPDTPLAGARNLIEKLRKVAAGVRPPWDPGRLTMSAGVAEAIARPDYDSEDIVTDLINRAEFSLEEARRKGGDTIVSLEISQG